MEKSCPNRQMLSVYYDGEMPSPWKEKMESHIAGCRECGEYLEIYRRVSREIEPQDSASDSAFMDETRERVWQRLEKSIAEKSRPVSYSPRAILRQSRLYGQRHNLWWKRNISVPLPVAVAAAAVLVVMAFVWVGRTPAPAEMSGIPIASEAEFFTSEMIPIHVLEDMEIASLRQLLNEIILFRPDMSVPDMSVSLPSTMNITSYSEPVMVRVADNPNNIQQEQQRRRRRH